MATADALKDLTEISTQIEAAVVLDREGTVLASTLDDERAGRSPAPRSSCCSRPRSTARGRRRGARAARVATRTGSVFVVRDAEPRDHGDDRAEPTVGLVFYDLKSCLRGLGEEEAKPKPKPSEAATAEEGG